MINRTLVRIKVIQLTYANLMQPDKSLDTAEKELIFSINKSLDLSKVILQLMIDVTEYQNSRMEAARQKFRPTQEELDPNMKFVFNKFIKQLSTNTTLNDFQKQASSIWQNNEDFLRRFTIKLIETPEYQAYMEKRDSTYEEDKELWFSLFRNYFIDNEDLMEVLEENSLYWNDDIFVVQTFIQKFFNQSTEDALAESVFVKYKNEEDWDFGRKLLHKVLIDQDELKERIERNVKNWELDRVALMDTIVLMCATAEIIAFPSIPTRVSFNEYIEIAKMYSTPKSGIFINGVLDKMVSELKEEKVISK